MTCVQFLPHCASCLWFAEGVGVTGIKFLPHCASCQWFAEGEG